MTLVLVSPPPPDEGDPTVLHRRRLIATALGTAAATVLPDWAAGAATTPDADVTTGHWTDAFHAARAELDRLGTHYVTIPGLTAHTDTHDSGLWLFAQARALTDAAPRTRARDVARLAAEAAAFVAGCHVDRGDNTAATHLYKAALTHTAGDPDLTAFVLAQADWVPMYSQRWDTVLRQADRAAATAETHGGPALLMGHLHRAHAHAALGDHPAARTALTRAVANVDRVPSAHQPPTALGYSAAKTHFSAAMVHAQLGDARAFDHARERAEATGDLGWMDRQLLTVAAPLLEADPEDGAEKLRYSLLRLHGDVSHCVRTESQRTCAALKWRQFHHGDGTVGPQVQALSHYLTTLTTAA